MQAVVVSEYFLANPKVDRRGNPSHNQLLVKLGRISRCHKLGTVLAMPDLHSKAAPQIRRETVAADDKLLKRLSSWLWKDSKNCMRRSLLSLAETFMPCLPEEEQRYRDSGNELTAKFYEFPGQNGHDPALADEILELTERHLPPEKLQGINILLWLMSSRIAMLLLGGRYALCWKPPFCLAFHEMDRKSREAMLLSWKESAILKPAYKGLQGVVLFVMFSRYSGVGKNALWECVGYPGPDPFKPEKPVASKRESEKALMASIVDMSRSTQAQCIQDLEEHGAHVLGSEAGAITLECDAVVVGSGAGGGTAAGVLASAGLKVIVVEKGTYTPAEELTTLEKDAYENLYERGGLFMTTETGEINIMAGATVGGGTRVNWSVSFRTPDHVRKEWAEVHGLKHFNSSRYERAMDAVCKRLDVKTGVKHNKANTLLWDGLETLGVDVEEMPRNCADSERCGHCTQGCASGRKQDTTATFLADAAKAGALILTGCFAQTVSTESSTGSREKRAVGVVANSNGDPNLSIQIKAKYVVASAGSIHNPALLLRSDLTCNGNVGKHLHLHVAAGVVATFPRQPAADDVREGRVHIWEGPQMSTYSREAAKWMGTGYGPLVSMTSAHPGLLAAGSPWTGAKAFRGRYEKLPWMAAACTYVRDKDAGSVVLGKDGLPRIHYWPSSHDQQSLIEGLALGARALAAAGAEALFTSQAGEGSEVHFTGKKNSQLRAKEVDKFVKYIHETGVKKHDIALFSLHQMGSCRMGSSMKDSVADGEGECWECANLYIADASAFPTASGVNPMITAESIAWMVSDGIATRHYH